MIFDWLRRRRRQKLLAEPFPKDWISILYDRVSHYPTLSPEEQARLQVSVRILAAEKEWEGCGGLEMGDEIKVTVAGFASLLVLGRKDYYFDRLMTILVYPDAYNVPGQPMDSSGLMIGDSARVGEAHYRGPLVLSWAEIQEDARYPERGKNVVVHEFAHELDMLNRWIDGMPNLDTPAQQERWQKVMGREFQHLVHAAERGVHTLLDPYGAENEAEFFAVATECFFLKPRSLLREHRDMYEVLREFYHQNPAERATPWEENL